jgi:hypothetical protein
MSARNRWQRTCRAGAAARTLFSPWEPVFA